MNQDTYAHAWTHRTHEPWFTAPVAPPDHAPNIVVILLDDTGYADLGCYGSEIATPTMDRLADEGVQYTNFHTTTLCSPSRAALLTGRNHHSVGMRMLANVDSGVPSGRGAVDPSAGNMAEILNAQGYNTFMVGKWHLAPMEQAGAAGPYTHWPLRRGFDRFYGFMEGATDQYYPELTEDNHRIDAPYSPEEGYHLTVDLVDQAVSMVRDQQSNAPEKPFFLYLALGATHAPHQAPAEYLERYRGRYDRGYDAIRQERFDRQLELGVIPENTVLPPRNPGVPAWEDLSDNQRAVSARLQEAYAGFLTHTDDQLARMLDALEKIGVLDDTLIVLLSDNGAAAEGGPTGAVSRIRFFNGLDEDEEFNLAQLDGVGLPGSDSHYPTGWAQVGNTPGRWYKYNVHSGGVRDPLIVRPPRGTAHRPGMRRQFHHIIDVAPTILAMAGVEYPEQIAGVAQMPVHGIDMGYTLDEPERPSNRRVQYFEMFGNRAIYCDGWKAVTHHTKGSAYERSEWELYNLAEDFSESVDLSAAEPERLDELIALWHVEAGKYGVFPLDDRTVELFGAGPTPHSPYARDVFTFYPGIAHQAGKSTPRLPDRSFTITAEVDYRAGDQGVLVVHGNRWSGYGVYVIEGRLVYEYNYCGEVTTLTSDPIPDHARLLVVDFTSTGHLEGTARLIVDGVESATHRFARTLSFPTLTGMDIGSNATAPFSERFERPFAYSGAFDRLTFTTGPVCGDHGDSPVDEVDQ